MKVFICWEDFEKDPAENARYRHVPKIVIFFLGIVLEIS